VRRVSPLDPALPTARALAIAADRVAGGVGTHETALPSPDVVDLGGRCVLPGFTDSHVHFPTWSLSQRDVRLEGVSGLADALENRVEIPYGEIPGWPVSTAVGHTGVLVLGEVDRVPIAVMRGRAHLYEGVSADQAVFGVRVLGRLGVRTLVVTNAAGWSHAALRRGVLGMTPYRVNPRGTSRHL